MFSDFPIEQTVRSRKSVRTYDGQPLPADIKEKIVSYAGAAQNPFSIDVRFRLIQAGETRERLGTYGVIAGAVDYIGAAVKEGEMALEAVGYSFEKLILYAAWLGLGTCWLGGTLRRGDFMKAMDIRPGELFPAASPIGRPSHGLNVANSVFRAASHSSSRKDWESLFFGPGFSAPLPKDAASDYAFPLEMLRLAPSASNGQPWRVAKDGPAFHFFMAGAAKQAAGMDLRLVDMGIAACHFHLAAMEKDLSGGFKILPSPPTDTPSGLNYRFSWIAL